MKNEERALEFLRNIKGTVNLMYHEDCDGASSAALIIKFLKTKGIKTDIATGQFDAWRIEEFLKKEYDNYIFVDFCLEGLYTELKDKFKGKHILIIDHHPSKEIKKAVHVNPRFDDPDAYISASMVVEGIVSKLGLKQEWLGRLGGVADMATEGTDQENEATHLIDSYKAVRSEKGIIAVIKLMLKHDTLDGFLYDKELDKFKHILDKEIERQTSLFELQSFGEINFFQVRSRLRLTSILINHVSTLYPKKTLIFYRRDGDIYKISGRSHRYNLGKIFELATKGIGGCGGHAQACGANVHDMNIFKERVTRLLAKKEYLIK